MGNVVAEKSVKVACGNAEATGKLLMELKGHNEAE